MPKAEKDHTTDSVACCVVLLAPLEDVTQKIIIVFNNPLSERSKWLGFLNGMRSIPTCNDETKKIACRFFHGNLNSHRQLRLTFISRLNTLGVTV